MFCNRVENGLDGLRVALEKHIARQGEAALDKIADVAVNDPKQYVSTILKIYRSYHSLVTYSLKREPAFVQALDKGCASFINRNNITRKTNVNFKNPSKSPELLARYCDILLKESPKNPKENELEKFLHQIIIILKYIENKDRFEIFYMDLSAERLLNDLSASDEAESNMISKLKQISESEYTYKLQQMLNDNRLSKNITERYKQHLASKNMNLGLDFSIMVIGSGVWPFSQSPIFNIPVQLTKSMESFNEFYQTQHKDRKLTWLLAQCRCELSAHGFQRKYTFTATTAQMAVLMMYNENTEMTLQQICDNTKLRHEIVTQIVQALVKMELLSIVGPKIDIDANTPLSTVLRLNSDFSNEELKIDLSKAITPVAERQKTAEADGFMEKDRIELVQAAIVRIMKIRKKMKHSELIKEVFEQLGSRFTPNVKMFKKSIDFLIDRDYLQRMENEKNVYEYIP
ncbi:unnamed protein product [Onchocerca flexuosa]|uniref:CULLIN_2 domain-containing protein n=1 Tax=Onchocerca flexuosa TaxID=387005 RepID=A0A183H893_9BILA|nr:unnamed protein product [Onchocerca flexuosa]